MADQVPCPDCGAPMRLRHSKHGLFFGCSNYPNCRGTHAASPEGQPIGTPGTAADKAARVAAHAVFDTLWKTGGMGRSDAYRWLHKTLPHLPRHICDMTADQANELIRVVKGMEHKP